MFQISRAAGETIKIGDGVELVIVAVEDGRVKVGIKGRSRPHEDADHFDDRLDSDLTAAAV